MGTQLRPTFPLIPSTGIPNNPRTWLVSGLLVYTNREPTFGDGGWNEPTDWTLLQQFKLPVLQLVPPPPLATPLGMAVAVAAIATMMRVKA